MIIYEEYDVILSERRADYVKNGFNGAKESLKAKDTS